MSYLDFYHLQKEPFNVTPDPEFLFLSPSHKEALAAIIYGITKRKGIIAITGEVGVGKTTILRSYLDGADSEALRTVYIFNSNISFVDVVRTIYDELDIQAKSDNLFDLVDGLHRALVEEYKQGRNVVVIVDEAQNMPVETLESLRMLSNLETSKDKLIQIVLIGQPELEEKLNRHELRQLKQRIALRQTILPLTEEDSHAYLTHRQAKVRMKRDSLFTDQAEKLIVKEANGIPRLMNIIADNSLITGYGYQQRPVGAKIVREVIADFRGQKKPSGFWRWGAAALISTMVLAAAIWLLVGSTRAVEQSVAAPGIDVEEFRQQQAELRQIAATAQSQLAKRDQQIQQLQARLEQLSNERAQETQRKQQTVELQQQLKSEQEEQRVLQAKLQAEEKERAQLRDRLVQVQAQQKKLAAMVSQKPSTTPARSKSVNRAQKTAKPSTNKPAASVQQSKTKSTPESDQQAKEKMDYQRFQQMQRSTAPVSSTAAASRSNQPPAANETGSEQLSMRELKDEVKPLLQADTGGREPAVQSESASTDGGQTASRAIQSAKANEIVQDRSTGSNDTSGEGEDATELTQDVVKPQIIRYVPPSYPYSARTKSIQGTVFLSVLVTENGEPASVRVLRGVDSSLDTAAMAAARQWKFSPAFKDGEAVRVWITYPITFRLN